MFSPLGRGEYSYDVELNASANMFYLLKNLLYLNLVIVKLKCNNLIFNAIMVLFASYVCLLYSGFVENHPIWILEMDPSFLRWFCHMEICQLHGDGNFDFLLKILVLIIADFGF
jgi:hypothetical protein